MKNFLILIFMCLTSIVSAQYNGTFMDTCTTSGSTYSDTRYPLTRGTTVMGAGTVSNARQFNIESKLDIIGYTHRISGTLNAKIYLSYANGITPTSWIRVDSLTVTGTDDIPFHFTTTDYRSNRFRLECEAPSSTQSFGWYADWAVKPE